MQDGRKESLDGYVKTFSKPLPIDGNVGVFALDCEMVSGLFRVLISGRWTLDGNSQHAEIEAFHAGERVLL